MGCTPALLLFSACYAGHIKPETYCYFSGESLRFGHFLPALIVFSLLFTMGLVEWTVGLHDCTPALRHETRNWLLLRLSRSALES